MTSLSDPGNPRHYYDLATKYLESAEKLKLKQTPFMSLAAVLAALRGLYAIHQSHHWQVQGDNSYADHLLFQRLYEGILPEIDSVAEKLVGADGPTLTNFFLQNKMIEEFMKLAVQATSSTPLHENSMRAEFMFLALNNMCVAILKDSGKLSAGLEQTLGALAEKHEEHTFLLQQRAN